MDIIERLRTEQPSYVLIGDAAIEIERLRKQNQNQALDFIASEGEWCEMTDKKNKEIERLRDALQFYASKNNYEKKKVWTTTFPQYEPDGYKIVTPVLSDNGEKARAAFQQKESE